MVMLKLYASAGYHYTKLIKEIHDDFVQILENRNRLTIVRGAAVHEIEPKTSLKDSSLARETINANPRPRITLRVGTTKVPVTDMKVPCNEKAN